MAHRLALMLSSLLVAQSAYGARYHVRAQTISWGDQVVAGDGSLLRRQRLVQRLGFSAVGMRDGAWHFSSDLRIDTDLAREVSGDTLDGRSASAVALQHAYLAGRGLLDGRLDVTLGRQYRWEGPDLMAFDGARAQARGPWRLGLDLFAGLLVRRDSSYLGYGDLEPDGTVTTTERSPTLGFGLFTHSWSRLRIRAAWRRSWTGSDRSSDHLTTSGDWALLDRLRTRWSASWNLVLERFELAQTELEWTPVEALQLTLGVARVRPVFELDSIFPYFAGGPSDELSGRVRWNSSRWSLWLRVTGRRFMTLDGAELDAMGENRAPSGVLSEAPTALGVGGGLALRPTSMVRAGLTAWRQRGYGGDWLSLMSYGSLGLRGGDLELQARLRWTRYAADLLAEHSGEAVQAMAALAWLLSDQARVHLTGSVDLTPLASPSFRVMALLDLGLWL